MNNPYDIFFQVKDEFSLGSLTTESYHPLSQGLSTLVNESVTEAYKVLNEIDRLALEKIKAKSQEVFFLSHKIKQTLNNNGRVFLVGCGATGRLSLSIETIARMKIGGDHIVSFMAGGDYALIKSVESFEDSSDYGRRQLNDLGFKDNDFLVAITEGGETNFVIGACLEASKMSKLKPHFLYCNPKEELLNFKRCRDILENDQVDKLELVVGAMALSGSTRMQASTVQMFVTSFAYFYRDLDENEFTKKYQEEVKDLQNLDMTNVTPFTEKEADCYKNNFLVTYVSDKNSALTILTDTTERSPTFSLPSFEKNNDKNFSPVFLVVNKTKDPLNAWKELLSREPRGLNWDDLPISLSLKDIYEFDISLKHLERRHRLPHHKFLISESDNGFSFEFVDLKAFVNFSTSNPFLKQMALKLILNTHSTLLMGLINRYKSNVMTWVKPSNLKLIDRATRYVLYLAQEENIDLSYEEVAEKVIEKAKAGQQGRPIVLEILEYFKNV